MLASDHKGLRMSGKLLIAFLVMAGACRMAAADVIHDCHQDRQPEVTPEVSVRACTEIITSPSFGPDEKALAYRYRGQARTNAGAVQPAIADFTESIRLKKDDATAFEGRGQAKFAAGDLSGSIADFSDAIRLSPAQAELYVERGHVYIVSGNADAAIRDLTEAIRLNPSNARAFSERGIAYFNKTDLVRAQEDYTAGIAIFPFPEIYLNRAYVHEAQGNKAKALEDFRHALLNDPSLIKARDGLKRLGAMEATIEADQRVREGQALAEKNCSSCHAVGTKGVSPNKDAPAFRFLIQRHPLLALRTSITKGIAATHDQMPEFKFTYDGIDAIVAYINSLPTAR